MPLDASTITLDNVPQYLEEVRRKIAEVSGGSTVRGESMLSKDMGAGLGQLKNIKKKKNLIIAWGSIKERERIFNSSKGDFEEVLKVSVEETFLIAGHSSSEWKSVILARYRALTNELTLSNLKKFEEFLESRVSKEQKFSEDYGKFMKSINLGE